MTEHQEADAPFDARRARVIFEHDGTLTQLRERWKELLERDEKAIIINQQTGGIMMVLILIGVALMFGGSVFRVLLWLGLATLGFALYVYYRADLINRRDLLDTRKRKLVDDLIARLTRDLDAKQKVTLSVDFRSPRAKAVRMVSGQADQWSNALPSSTEPLTHEWLQLHAPLAGFDVDLRMRSLLGSSGSELRLRDELELELRSGVLSAAAELDSASLANPATTLVAHRLEDGRARLRFRGARVATRTPESPFDDEGISWALVGFVLRPILPEAWCAWDYQSPDALLTGTAVLGHLDDCALKLGPRASARP